MGRVSCLGVALVVLALCIAAASLLTSPAGAKKKQLEPEALALIEAIAEEFALGSFQLDQPVEIQALPGLTRQDVSIHFHNGASAKISWLTQGKHPPKVIEFSFANSRSLPSKLSGKVK